MLASGISRIRTKKKSLEEVHIVAFKTDEQTDEHQTDKYTLSAADAISVTDTHCKKYPYIHEYFLASFPHFNGTGSVYMYVCIGKSTK